MKKIIIAVLVIFAIGRIGASDYEAAKLQEKTYCENVANKVWPNYDTSIKCSTVKGHKE